MPTVKAVLQGKTLQDKYIPDFKDLSAIVRLLKESGYQIVLTQGVFDMFHVGHGRYLTECGSHGDVLIV